MWNMVVRGLCFGIVSLRMRNHETGPICKSSKREFGKVCRTLDMESAMMFQHDNDSNHTAKSVKKWLRDNKVNVLDWPSQSPSHNPIESFWVGVKKNINTRKPQNFVELENSKRGVVVYFC